LKITRKQILNPKNWAVDYDSGFLGGEQTVKLIFEIDGQWQCTVKFVTDTACSSETVQNYLTQLIDSEYGVDEILWKVNNKGETFLTLLAKIFT
jgi:hypothetical protein